MASSAQRPRAGVLATIGRAAAVVCGVAGVVALGLLVARTAWYVDGRHALRPTSVATDAAEAELATFGDGHALPFTLRLVRASADWRPVIAALQPAEEGGWRPLGDAPHDVQVGARLPALAGDGGRRVEMLRYLPRARVERLGFAASVGAYDAALQIAHPAGDPEQARWLVDSGEGSAPLPVPGAVIRFRKADTAADAAAWLAPLGRTDAGEVGILRAELPDGTQLEAPATRGQELVLVQRHSERVFRLRIVEATVNVPLYLQDLDPGVARTPLEREIPDHGAVVVEVVPVRDGEEGEVERAWAFGNPAFASIGNTDERYGSESLREAGVRLFLAYQHPLELRIVQHPDGSLGYVEERAGSVSPARALAAGDSLPLTAPDGRGWLIARHLPRAELDFEVAALPSQTDAEYLRAGLQGANVDEGDPALQVRIFDPPTAGKASWSDRWMMGAAPGARGTVLQLGPELLLSLVADDSRRPAVRAAFQALGEDGRILGERVLGWNDVFVIRGHTCRLEDFRGAHVTGGPIVAVRIERDPLRGAVLTALLVAAAALLLALACRLAPR